MYRGAAFGEENGDASRSGARLPPFLQRHRRIVEQEPGDGRAGEALLPRGGEPWLSSSLWTDAQVWAHKEKEQTHMALRKDDKKKATDTKKVLPLLPLRLSKLFCGTL